MQLALSIVQPDTNPDGRAAALGYLKLSGRALRRLTDRIGVTLA